MTTLVEKIRRAREQRVPAGKHTFIVRRPTDLEMMDLSRDRRPANLLRFVVGWDGVTEADLVNGGDPHPLPFDGDACTEWLSDRMDLFAPVTNAILEAHRAHRDALEQAEKN